MKKTTKFLIAGLVSASVLAGAGYALTSEDSLVTLDYVTAQFMPAAEQKGEEVGNQKLQGIYDAEKAKLDQAQKELQGLVEHGANMQYSAALTPMDSHDGELFELTTGGSVLMGEGAAGVYHNGAFIDVTTGEEVSNEGHLKTGHRYLVGENTTARVEIKSGVARLGVQSDYLRTGGNPDHLPFWDVSHFDWYYRNIEYVYQKGYFSGISANEFGPGIKMNRAMIVTVFYKMAGQPKDEMDAAAHHSFKDVPEDKWYAPFVKWAYDQKITGGTGPNTFDPEALVTREQFAQLLYNFSVHYLGKELTQRGDLDVFLDRDRISGWAEDAVSWAVAAGVLGSMYHDQMKLLPQWAGDRASMAGMLYDYEHLG